MRLRVDLDLLGGAEGALRSAVQVARELASARGELSELGAAHGSQMLRVAAERFVDRWSCGMELVAQDADKLASILQAAPSVRRAHGAIDHPAWTATDHAGDHVLKITITAEPDRIEVLGAWIATFADQAAEAAARLGAINAGAWTGEGAGAFGEAVAKLSTRLDAGARALHEAASAFSACAAVLWEAELRATQAGVVPADLYARSGTPLEGTAQADPSDGTAAGTTGGGGERADTVYALGTVEDARTAVEAATHRTAARLERAADLAPHQPGPHSRQTDIRDEAGGGVWDSVWGLGIFAFELTAASEVVDPGAYVENMQGLAGGLSDGTAHRVTFANGIVPWDMWLHNRARAFGALLPVNAETEAGPEPDVETEPAVPLGAEVEGAPGVNVETEGEAAPGLAVVAPPGTGPGPAVEAGAGAEWEAGPGPGQDAEVEPEWAAAGGAAVRAESGAESGSEMEPGPGFGPRAEVEAELGFGPGAAVDAVQLRRVVEVPGARPERGPLRVRGPSSGRLFDPTEAGGRIRRLTASQLRITQRGVDVVEKHLARFGPGEADAAMVARLRRITAAALEATPADRHFCAHGLRVFVRYRRLGHPTGDPGYDVWNNAHTAALEDYGLREGPGVLYHSSATP